MNSYKWILKDFIDNKIQLIYKIYRYYLYFILIFKQMQNTGDDKIEDKSKK